MSKKRIPSRADYIPARLEGLSEDRLRWIYLIVTHLCAADEKHLRAVFFFLKGYMKESQPVSKLDTTERKEYLP